VAAGTRCVCESLQPLCQNICGRSATTHHQSSTPQWLQMVRVSAEIESRLSAEHSAVHSARAALRMRTTHIRRQSLRRTLPSPVPNRDGGRSLNGFLTPLSCDSRRCLRHLCDRISQTHRPPSLPPVTPHAAAAHLQNRDARAKAPWFTIGWVAARVKGGEWRGAGGWLTLTHHCEEEVPKGRIGNRREGRRSAAAAR
jgi:hypothetical protein